MICLCKGSIQYRNRENFIKIYCFINPKNTAGNLLLNKGKDHQQIQVKSKKEAEILLNYDFFYFPIIFNFLNIYF